MFPYYAHTQRTISPTVPTFPYHLHVNGDFIETFEMGSQEDLDLVMAHAQMVRDHGRAERAPLTMSMIPYLKQTIVEVLRDHIPMILREDRECTPRQRMCARG